MALGIACFGAVIAVAHNGTPEGQMIPGLTEGIPHMAQYLGFIMTGLAGTALTTIGIIRDLSSPEEINKFMADDSKMNKLLNKFRGEEQKLNSKFKI